jgi:hypothetical protein
VVNLQAEIASQEDKEYLAEALFYLREPSTGTVDGDIRKLSSMINRQVPPDIGTGYIHSDHYIASCKSWDCKRHFTNMACQRAILKRSRSVQLVEKMSSCFQR